MVVSDIGAKLSPKAAPAKIATPNIVGLDPRNTPAGYITGTSDRTVPVLEPVPSANRQAAINATKVNTDPVAPAFVPNHSNPSTSPPATINLPKTPANNHAVIMTIPFLSPNPRSTD